ncbi:D-amino-acid oxidase, partial [Tremellales sp. Uapishka_1]
MFDVVVLGAGGEYSTVKSLTVSDWSVDRPFSFETEYGPRAEYDEITFKKLKKLATEHPDLCERLPFVSVWSRPKVGDNTPWFHELVGEYKDLQASESSRLPGGLAHGQSFTSYVLHAPNYTAHLGSEVRKLGIPIFRRRVMSLQEAYHLPGVGSVDLVVNATGLGAKVLIGVEDDTVYPARGQTVLVHAPEVRRCIMHAEGFMAPPPKPGEGESLLAEMVHSDLSQAPLPLPAYMIPRPGPEGNIVLGGTYLKNDYSTLPDLAESERILKACYELEPLLAGPNGKSWRDIKVVSHNVGLRPAREAGVKLELESVSVGGKEAAVLHAYGVGSAGFQSSLGIAEKGADLAMEYFAKLTPKAKL